MDGRECYVSITITSDKITKLMNEHQSELDLFYSFDNGVWGEYKIEDDVFIANASNLGCLFWDMPKSKEGIVKALASLFSFGEVFDLAILQDEDIEIQYNEELIPLLEALLINEKTLTESITSAEWTSGFQNFGEFGDDKKETHFTYDVENGCKVENK